MHASHSNNNKQIEGIRWLCGGKLKTQACWWSKNVCICLALVKLNGKICFAKEIHENHKKDLENVFSECTPQWFAYTCFRPSFSFSRILMRLMHEFHIEIFHSLCRFLARLFVQISFSRKEIQRNDENEISFWIVFNVRRSISACEPIYLISIFSYLPRFCLAKQ